jgi:hypothetical protein
MFAAIAAFPARNRLAHAARAGCEWPDPRRSRDDSRRDLRRRDCYEERAGRDCHEHSARQRCTLRVQHEMRFMG